jgi:hypothetical protein
VGPTLWTIVDRNEGGRNDSATGAWLRVFVPHLPPSLPPSLPPTFPPSGLLRPWLGGQEQHRHVPHRRRRALAYLLRLSGHALFLDVDFRPLLQTSVSSSAPSRLSLRVVWGIVRLSRPGPCMAVASFICPGRLLGHQLATCPWLWP